MKTALEVFSDNLDQLLAKQEKTQADLARYMKVSTATASDWCNAHKMPRVDKIKAIANWLHVSMGDLLEERHYRGKHDTKHDTNRKKFNLYVDIHTIRLQLLPQASGFSPG